MTERKTRSRLTGGIIAVIVLAVCLVVTTDDLAYSSASVRDNSFATGGVPAEVMGVGPIEAVPKALKKAGLTLEEMDTIELNEAFASQALACIRTLGMDPARVNPWGGAMALGHPLGATGAILTCKALSYLEHTGGRYGMVTMCIGGGMGAAGIIERL